MSKIKRYYAYPAILDDSENGKGIYTVSFPDIQGAFTEGKGIANAIMNGKEVLEGILVALKSMPKSSNIEDVRKANPDKIVTYIVGDLKHARKITKWV